MLNKEKSQTDKKTAWPLVGNRHVTDFLEKSLANGRISNAYIFLGPKDLGKTGAAAYFAKCLLCQKRKEGEFHGPCGQCPSCLQLKGLSDGLETVHGDFHLLKRGQDKKNISIDDVRDFIHDLSLSSFFNSYKVGIIKEADDLGIEAANALLKTLEEPQAKVVVILTASRLESIPATIVSRSQVLRLYPVATSLIYDYLLENFGCQRSEAKIASRLSLGRPALAARFIEEPDFYAAYQEKASVFLDFFQEDLNSRLAAVSSLIEKEDEEEKTTKALKILSIWQGAARDALLLASNNGDLIQHEDQRAKLSVAGQSAAISGIIRISRLLKKGEEYIRANVNPRLVLENIAANIAVAKR